jgi:hypothetical protein
MTGPIRCTGRAVDRDGRPHGHVCGEVVRPRWGGTTVQERTPAALLQMARAAGWAIGTLPDGSLNAMCKACRKPSPDLVRLCDDLARSVTSR